MAVWNSIRLWSFALICGFLLDIPHSALCEGPSSSAPGKITSIPPGTRLDPSQSSRWNRIILLAVPRIASGDTTALSESVRQAASKFTLCIVASVARHANVGAGSPSDPAEKPALFKLDDVGVGYGLEVGKRLTVVSSDSAARLGAKLGFLESRVLAENEKHVAELRLVARSTTLAIFDAPSIMLRDGQHKPCWTRHLIWIDPATGRVSAWLWLLAKSDKGGFRALDEPLRLLAPETREDRAIHVDGSQFFLGIPTEQAFALEQLPPGKPVPWTNPLRQLAALESYTASQLIQLTDSLQ